jgi:hypothetical protein
VLFFLVIPDLLRNPESRISIFKFDPVIVLLCHSHESGNPVLDSTPQLF